MCGRYDRDRPEFHEENQEILQEELSPKPKTRDYESAWRHHLPDGRGKHGGEDLATDHGMQG